MSAPALAPPPVPPAPASLARRAWRTAHERRGAARDTYLAARRQGETLTGAQLATRYGMSERWGRSRIAEARTETGNGRPGPLDDRQVTSQPAPDRRTARTTGNGGRTVPARPDSGNGNGNGNGTNRSITQTGNGTDPTLNGNAVPAAAASGNGTPTINRKCLSGEAAHGNLPVLPASGNGADRHNGNGTGWASADAGSGTVPATAERDGYRSSAGMPLPGNGTGGASHNGTTDMAVNGGTQNTNGDAGGPAMPATGLPPTAAVPETSTAQRRLMTTAVVVVAAVAASASYDHQRALAELAGEGWRSWLLPLSVDGLLTAATMLMLTRRRAGQRAGALTWTALALGIVTSVAANVVGADPTLADPVLVGRLVAAWPPLALFLSLELLMRQLGVRHDGGDG